MTTVCRFTISLYYLCSDGNLNFFNGVKYQRAKPSVKTIQINYIREMNVALQKFMVGRWIYIILERIRVCTKSIIT